MREQVYLIIKWWLLPPFPLVTFASLPVKEDSQSKVTKILFPVTSLWVFSSDFVLSFQVSGLSACERHVKHALLSWNIHTTAAVFLQQHLSPWRWAVDMSLHQGLHIYSVSDIWKHKHTFWSSAEPPTHPTHEAELTPLMFTKSSGSCPFSHHWIL